MKHLLTITLCLNISIISLAQEDNVFMDKFAEIHKAFDTRDINAFSSQFTDQVNFIGPYGNVATTKQQVHDSHVFVFKMLGPKPEGVTEVINMIQSQNLGNDHHLLTVETKQTLGDETQHLVFTFIFVKIDSNWKVRSAQLTPVLEHS